MQFLERVLAGAATLARVAAASWVGAATLFVVTGVQEVRTPAFDSITKSALVLLRFPAYYAFGFALVATSFLASIITASGGRGVRRQFTIATFLLGVTLALMVADYFWVYQPLAEMTAQLEQARPAGFRDYHHASMYLNTTHVGICLVAAVVASWPMHPPNDEIET